MVQVCIPDYKMSLWVLFVYLFQVFIDTIIYSFAYSLSWPKQERHWIQKESKFVCLFVLSRNKELVML
jgi:hypothetical protein